MVFRFVHAADIHLDSPLRSLALRDPELAELIGNATRRAFVSIIDLCLTEQVDALMLAGDLYDAEQTSMKTARFLTDQVRRLHEARIRVFIIRGNHDAMSRITRELTFPDSVTLYTARADAISVPRPFGERPVIVHGMSFSRPQAPDSLLPRYRPPIEGAINIGLMHTSLDGSGGQDPYAPCSLAALDDHGFDYWALGHIHERSVTRGHACIVMAGMPQGRDIGESGPKSATLITIGSDRSVNVKECATNVAQFERLPIDLTGFEEWRDIVDAIDRAFGTKRDEVVAEHLVARLRLTGTTRLAWRIRRDRDILHAEAANRAFVAGKCWIDNIEIECRAQGEALAPPSANPATELEQFIERELIDSAAYQAEIAVIAEDIRDLLPQECRRTLGDDEAQFLSRLKVLIREGSKDVLARLHASAATGSA